MKYLIKLKNNKLYANEPSKGCSFHQNKYINVFPREAVMFKWDTIWKVFSILPSYKIGLKKSVSNILLLVSTI